MKTVKKNYIKTVMQSTFIISNNNVKIKYVKFFKYISKIFKCCDKIT